MTKENKYIPALRFNWLTKLYDPIVRFTMPEREFKEALIRQANVEEDYHVLDFGCGSLTLSLMAKHTHPNTHVHAIDVDEKILKIARAKQQASRYQIHINRYDGRILPYQPSSFDRVMSSLVFHHLDKDQKQNSLFEIFRVLKPGGELHIADWGKAKNGLMRTAFYTIQLLDGFKTTTDNVDGRLPDYITKAGFSEVMVTKEFQTIFGTLALYKAVKPKPISVL